MENITLSQELKSVSRAMFKKNFFGIFHGSISARVDYSQFLINKKNAIFSDIDENSLIELYSKKDYRWKEASIDADIHLNIYKNIPEAKFICYAMPPFTVALSLVLDEIVPKDYFAKMKFNNIKIYNPKKCEDWYERAETEIYRYMIEKNTNIMIIKGYGVYVYERNSYDMAKNVALVENSCKVLYYQSNFLKSSLEKGLFE